MNLAQKLAPDLAGLQQLEAMIAAGGRPPIGETLDFTLVEASEGHATFFGTPGIHAYNPIGTVHGGYAATLLDSACGCAVHSMLSAQQVYTTLELKVSYQKAITTETGPLRAEGRVISFGRRAAFAEADLKDASGRIYATATSTLLVMERKVESA
ncbi:PaaI family thioesterase [[Pseudomonas] boreopolis]|uniref:PaaI family thioesterase n=1 Tax=Xanthomonas boreopolis TaxID=86183 RepID=UPI003D9ABCCE